MTQYNKTQQSTTIFWGEKGEHFVLFFCNFGQANFGYSATQYKNRSSTFFRMKKASISCRFLQVWARKLRAQYKKNGRHSVLFLNVFGKKTDETVPKKSIGGYFPVEKGEVSALQYGICRRIWEWRPGGATSSGPQVGGMSESP